MNRLASLGMAALGLLFTAPAGAQIVLRPILTKDVDAPGRTPYQASSAGPCNTATSAGGACFFTFPIVPMGKRLVIEQVNVQVLDYEDATLGAPRVHLITNCRLFSGCPGLLEEGTMDLLLPSFRVFPNSGQFWGVNASLLAYVEEVALPAVVISHPRGGQTGGSAGVKAVVTGYLIDKAN